MAFIQPVIICTKSESNFWPLTREEFPNEFITLNEKTFLEEVISHLKKISSGVSPILICEEKSKFLAFDSVVSTAKSLFFSKKTTNFMPTMTIAALQSVSEVDKDNEPIFLVIDFSLTASLIKKFEKSFTIAKKITEEGNFVFWGTNFFLSDLYNFCFALGEEEPSGVFKVRQVVSTRRENQSYITKMPDMCSYGGVVMFKPSLYLEALQKHEPDKYNLLFEAWQRKEVKGICYEAKIAEEVSLDFYAVTSYTEENSYVIPFFEQADRAKSWKSIYDAQEKNHEGNVVVGDVVQYGNHNCYMHSTDRLLAVAGVENLSVIETGDAVLVVPTNGYNEQQKLLKELKKKKRSELNSHARVIRPWGSYECVAVGEHFQVKKITVRQDGMLSLQMHHHRSEHWVVVGGTAKVTVGDTVSLMKEGESIYVPLGETHRLENPGRVPLVLIEVQIGNYLGEDDIVRFADEYGRV